MAIYNKFIKNKFIFNTITSHFFKLNLIDTLLEKVD